MYLAWGFRTAEGDVKAELPIEVAPTFTVGMMRRPEEARDSITISSQSVLLR